jgi:glycosyltransferase 2 family protein
MTDHAAQDQSVMTRPSPLGTWAWFILKNLIGWLLILSSFPLGAFIPGPGGIPLFLIGFGLITFPGKRRLVARVLRGRPIPAGSRLFKVAAVLLAVVLPGLALLYLLKSGRIGREWLHAHPWIVAGAYVVLAMLLTWVGIHSRGVLNRLIARIPKIRRKVRPWLRRKGIDLLPRRRRKRIVRQDGHGIQDDPEIIEIHERHMNRMRRGWTFSKPWLRRAIGLGITITILVLICRPIVQQWDAISDRIATIRWTRFCLAALMFAVFLFVFRATVWRRILAGLGHHLPVAPATRIWSTSELARYLPGVIWQVYGRLYLARPYGVRGSHCSASQVLELVIFLLANLLVAIACLLFLGTKEFNGAARQWLYVAMALVPVLVFLLHPRVLYPLMNGILRRLGKPLIVPRMTFGVLAGLLLWTMIGIVWQSLAIWLVVEEPLGLRLVKWWVVAGAYCLAWCAGFLAFWAQGGLGVRELVLIGALSVALPPAIHNRFTDHDQLIGVIMFLSVLLRLWATTGELILASVAYAFDWKGALRGGSRANYDREIEPEETPREVSGTLSRQAASPPAPAPRTLPDTAAR